MEIYNRLEIPTASITPRSSSSLDIMANRDRGLLIEMSGSAAGRVHSLSDEVITVGRGADCALMFDDSTLSRVHARLRREGDEFVLEDAGSLNGSFVNLQRRARVVLSHGDRLRFGSGVRLQFQLVNVEEELVITRMYQAAVLDGLTGLTNRRAFDQRLEAELAHAVRHERELTVLLIDVDHFKRVNDLHGHLAGDEVLRAISKLLAREVRCEDLAARYGGEEFVVIARDVPTPGAITLAERLRYAVQAQTVSFEALSISVTVSIGVANLSGLLGEPRPSGLLAAADKALYEAKDSGRNRVSVAGSSSAM
jgi:two-component system, cell cycle response regulator